MNLLLRIRPGPQLPGPTVAAVVWLGFASLVLPPARAGFPVAHGPSPVAGRVVSAGPSLDRAGVVSMIEDVALRPDGILEGRVVGPGDGSATSASSRLTVTLFRGGQTVVRTRTDVHGRFAFRDLSGGLYRVVVDTTDGSSWRFSRVWTYSGAPPHASRRVKVPVPGTLLRGQSPFGTIGASRAATIAGIAVGAIVPPIIYCGVKRDGRIPASP